MSKNCLFCDKSFLVKHRGHSNLYCSLFCYWEYRRKHPEIFRKNYTQKKCLHCGNFFFTKRQSRTNQYCSQKCFYEYRRNHPEIYHKTNCVCKRCGNGFYRKPGYLKKHGEDGLYCSTRCLKGNPFICLVCKKEFHRKPSQVKEGAGKFCSNTCKHLYQRQGVESGGETYEDRQLLRQSSRYKSWRLASKKLRGNKCQKCGIKDRTFCKCCGNRVYLHINHVKPFAIYSELRFDPQNSSVLCSKCHLGL